MQLWVNGYEAGRAYGGPEEGGWWFDTGTPIFSLLVELTDEERAQVDADFQRKHGIDRPGAPDALLYTDTYAQAFRDFLWAKARKICDEWREAYPYTGKRSSVLGGDDYNVGVEEHFARPYPTTIPHYE